MATLLSQTSYTGLTGMQVWYDTGMPVDLKAAQTFTVPAGYTWTISSIDIYGRASGATAGSLGVYNASGSVPGGILLGACTIDCSKFGATTTVVTATLTPLALTAGRYAIVFSGVNVSSAWACTSSSVYSDGNGATKAGTSAWSSTAGDAAFVLYGTSEADAPPDTLSGRLLRLS